jgi:hypothetical protein
MNRVLSTLFVVGTLLAGAAGCASTTTNVFPWVPPADPYESMPLAASWSSADNPHSQTHELPAENRLLRLRARCLGAGTLQVHISGLKFTDDLSVPCNDRWYGSSGFPIIGEIDPGPFPIVIDVTDPVSSWYVEVRTSAAPQASSS